VFGCIHATCEFGHKHHCAWAAYMWIPMFKGVELASWVTWIMAARAAFTWLDAKDNIRFKLPKTCTTQCSLSADRYIEKGAVGKTLLGRGWSASTLAVMKPAGYVTMNPHFAQAMILRLDWNAELSVKNALKRYQNRQRVL